MSPRSADVAGQDTAPAPDDLEGLEGSPPLPSATLAAHASTPAEPSTIVPNSSGALTREIWELAWPVMLSQVLFNAVGLIDIAMVGRLGAEAVAAVGYATQFFFLTQSVLFAVGFACVALMARAIGAGDGLRARHVLAASLAVAVVTALVLIVAVLAAPRELLELLGAEPAVVARGTARPDRALLP